MGKGNGKKEMGNGKWEKGNEANEFKEVILNPFSATFHV
jgi:hypothetical protein